jgi:hypothetical protein
MVIAGAGLDPGGILGAVLCMGLVAVIAVVTARPGSGRRKAGGPIYRRGIYTRYGRTGRGRRGPGDGPDGDEDFGNYSDSGHLGDAGHSGSSCGSGCGGGGGGD